MQSTQKSSAKFSGFELIVGEPHSLLFIANICISMFLYLCQTLAYLWKCVNSLVFHKKGTGNCFKSQFRCLFVRICLLSFYFSLNYLLPDCYVLRTPTILPQYSHIVKLTLHFFAHIVGVFQGHFSTFVQAQVEKTF